VIPVQLPPSAKDPADLALLAKGSTLFCAAIRDAVACHGPVRPLVV